ncbi:MAG TPA: uracil-DNA glycosylase [Salegentibacter sp.]|nr:uracil-DNA glycosylase [Salegentibacter sp.]
MKPDLPPDWKKELQEEIEKDYFQELLKFVEQEYADNICYPPADLVFNAFRHSSFENTKVVILGQDPYPNPGQAHGLCFSVNDGVKFPPSLKNIFREIESDLKKPIPFSGNLERWADQGVLLLNATLSVRANITGSHQKKGWEKYTDRVISVISEKKENVVFLLWGGFAQKKIKLIDQSKHLVLTSGHPSPLSANRGYWFGNGHFSKTNEYLIQKGKKPIDW